MPSQSWIQEGRAASVAFLLLTETRAATVTREPPDTGFDFRVNLLPRKQVTGGSIAVEVEPSTTDAPTRYRPALSMPQKRAIESAVMPVLLLVVNVRNERAAGAWLKEPVVPGPSLVQVYRTESDLSLQKVTTARLEKWYAQAAEYYGELSAAVTEKPQGRTDEADSQSRMLILEPEMEAMTAQLVSNVAKRLKIHHEWLTTPELRAQVVERDPQAGVLLEAHLAALRTWYDFHRKVAREGKQGRLSPTETQLLARLIKAKNQSRDNLARYFDGRKTGGRKM